MATPEELKQALALPPGQKVAAGGYHSVAYLETGEMFTWGMNENGQLGNGSTEPHLLPEKVFDSVLSVSAGWYHTIAVKKTGECFVWGSNRHGQLGDETLIDRLSPVQVLADEWVVGACAGAEQSLAICRKFGIGPSVLWVWGTNVSTGWNGPPRGMELAGAGGPSTRPVRILEGVRSCAAGHSHSLAVMEDGRLFAWGRNQYGQLGDGSQTTKLSPVHVLDNVREATAGADFSLAVMENGDLYAWGHNRSGCLGNGTIVDRPRPTRVMLGVRAAVAGHDFSFAIMEDGELRGWGSNAAGALGQRAAVIQLLPIAVMSDVVTVAAGGRHSLAVLQNGHCLVWGRNTHGQLGNGTLSKLHPGAHLLADLRAYVEELERRRGYSIKEDAPVPANEELSKGIHRIRGAYHKDGRLLRKERTFHTEYKDERTIRLIPEATENAPSALERYEPLDDEDIDWASNSDLAIYGGVHAYARRRMSDGEESDNLLPVAILRDVVDASAGGGHSLVALANGECASFGWNHCGQLGNGSKDKEWMPIRVLENVHSVAAGWYHSLATTNDGNCWAWGRNNRGQLGAEKGGQESLRPVKMLSMQVRAVAVGVDHSLLLLNANNFVVACGGNSFGQIGNHTMNDAYMPVIVFHDAKSIAAGRYHSHAVRTIGTCFSWGRNTHGQLGDGSTERKLSPVEVLDVKHCTHLCAGVDHCLAACHPQICKAWGHGGNGRLGNGETQHQEIPSAVLIDNEAGSSPWLEDVMVASAGQYHSLAVLKNGDCYAWGYNGNGQLGDGTQERRLKPVKILEGVATVSAGGAHSLAVLRTGECLAWGWNNTGQLGARRPADLRSPDVDMTRIRPDTALCAPRELRPDSVLSAPFQKRSLRITYGSEQQPRDGSLEDAHNGNGRLGTSGSVRFEDDLGGRSTRLGTSGSIRFEDDNHMGHRLGTSGSVRFEDDNHMSPRLGTSGSVRFEDDGDTSHRLGTSGSVRFEDDDSGRPSPRLGTSGSIGSSMSRSRRGSGETDLFQAREE